jgi:uncharacterized protein
MRKALSRTEALLILKEAGCSEGVVRHSVAVSSYAVRLAEKIRDSGHPVDVSFVESAAILHDVGRSKTHGIAHGVEGAKLLSDYPPYARVCERHIGAGLTRGEAKSLRLPDKDFLPKTLEEKIIAHADNLVRGEKLCRIDEALKRFESKLGKNHPAVKRMIRLSKFIDSLTA